jgi:hypothetical protein
MSDCYDCYDCDNDEGYDLTEEQLDILVQVADAAYDIAEDELGDSDAAVMDVIIILDDGTWISSIDG